MGVICTLAVDGWAVTFGTARRGLGGLRHQPSINGQYTNCIFCDVALILPLDSKGLSNPNIAPNKPSRS